MLAFRASFVTGTYYYTTLRAFWKIINYEKTEYFLASMIIFQKSASKAFNYY
jgi:hypothetical protein